MIRGEYWIVAGANDLREAERSLVGYGPLLIFDDRDDALAHRDQQNLHHCDVFKVFLELDRPALLKLAEVAE